MVADSTKLGGHAFARITRTEEIDLLITDLDAPEDAIRRFEEAGVKVMRV